MAVSADWEVSGLDDPSTVPSLASDFVGGVYPTGSISFAVGQSKAVIAVPVLADTLAELNERFAVTLSNASPGATIGTASAGAVVFNDDINLAISPAKASLFEGDSGTASFSFTVTRSGNGAAVSVDWAVTPFGADAKDFAGGVMPSGTLSFAANQNTRTITVQTVGDIEYEPDDVFRVELSGASAGVTITNGIAVGTILADDSEITIGAVGPVAYEGTGGVSPYGFVLTRNSATPANQTVAWEVRGADGQGTVPATAADFAGGVLPSGIVTFGAGENSKELIIPVLADARGS